MNRSAPVVLNLISSLGIGGAERLLIDTIRVSAQDAGVTYIAAIMNEAVNPGFFAELEATGVPVYRLERREGHLHPKYLKALLAIVDRHGVDVIHTHNEGSRTWGMAVKLVRPRVKLVYTVHSHDNAESITGLKRLAYSRLIDATVAISDFVAGTATVLNPRRLVTIPNGVNLDRFAGLEREPAGGGVFTIVNVARFIRFKGQDVLIEALALARARGLDARCIFVGTIAEQEFFDELAAQVTRAGLGDAVRFEIGRSDIETFFAEADAFVLSSRDEGFGIVLIEAMAAGLPVIAPKVGGAAEIVVDGESGLHFRASDPADLSEAIQRMAGDRSLQRRLADGGRARAATYDIRRMAGQLRDLYRSLVT